MQLLIAGDLVPTNSNQHLFAGNDAKSLLGRELLSLWSSSDVRIFNLEAPLTDKLNPIAKCGPNLVAPENAIRGINALNPTLITLANNHILDQGTEGLESTQRILRENGIPYVGAGNNLGDASRPQILKRNGMVIGVYACAEHEFSIATEKNPGANPFDLLKSLEHIKKLKNQCDYVVVLHHGGKEHYRYPSPKLQVLCRSMVDNGADIVICQHSHCVGCFEEYRKSTIIYGQGNFIFDDFDSELWQTSLIISIEMTSDLRVDYVPIIKEDNVVRLAEGDQKNEILHKFYERSNEICHEGFVEQHYKKFAEDSIDSYLRNFWGFGKWLSRIDRWLLGGLLLKSIYNEEKILTIQNHIECESHLELLITGLKAKQRDAK
ncbi:MAG: CapA family protein [Bacillota bacterium]|nr:CapA family protein [Bacillota bacterium]